MTLELTYLRKDLCFLKKEAFYFQLSPTECNQADRSLPHQIYYNEQIRLLGNLLTEGSENLI